MYKIIGAMAVTIGVLLTTSQRNVADSNNGPGVNIGGEKPFQPILKMGTFSTLIHTQIKFQKIIQHWVFEL